MGGQYTRRAPPVYASGHAALELEEVVEFREDEKKTQLLIGTAQAHREPALRRPALDQHQRPKPGAVHLSCAAHVDRSEEHTSELQSLAYLVCRLLLEKKKKNISYFTN